MAQISSANRVVKQLCTLYTYSERPLPNNGQILNVLAYYSSTHNGDHPSISNNRQPQRLKNRQWINVNGIPKFAWSIFWHFVGILLLNWQQLRPSIHVMTKFYRFSPIRKVFMVESESFNLEVHWVKT